ncbi:Eco57I restriction-modification methylase domain-containing protein [Actinobacillus pleuropneumoniae]|uniref:Eco57I restriction-modification methylase domain-containing protein n=1 Tax=Actinobacillus pleuropneumoniae TaxID=715 RepID=UPI001EEDF33F|nr:Eco57I restriction-modification methylase domain-containing protein [Actinobacillus pleuropneumoniae]
MIQSPENIYIKQNNLAHRKKYAQFFTPEIIADIMTDWIVTRKNLKTILEPAFGLGIFSRKILEKNVAITIDAYEVDNVIANSALIYLDKKEKYHINIKNYIDSDYKKYDGIICNPPYLKFHNYDNEYNVSKINSELGLELTKFTNLYALFMIKSIYQMGNNSRMAYIVPSEFLNSDYGVRVKEVLLESGLLRHIIIFDFKEKIFDGAITTACILLFSNDNKKDQNIYFSVIANIAKLEKIKKYIAGYPNNQESDYDFSYKIKELDPKKKWRVFYTTIHNKRKYSNLVPFENFAKVSRGIATGANEYFLFSKSKIYHESVSSENLQPCICSSSDISRSIFTLDDFNFLYENDKKVYIFNGELYHNKHALEYIKKGEILGVNKKYLTSKRTPWYSVEKRVPAPILVSVFNRTGIRFIRNEANISNLTNFHCVYFNRDDLDVDLFFAYLLTDISKEILDENRREYGNGLKKFEPNDLNKSVMLDLTLLSSEERDRILSLYRDYRALELKKEKNSHFLDSINKIFKERFSID